MLDFPQRVASLVFYGGCNLRCPYCHNPTLVENPNQYPDIPTEDILVMLEQRRGFIDGVVISGGEPTLDPHLDELLRQIKQQKLQIKLDTNGLRPQVLESLLAQQLVDFVGLDLKTALPRYGELYHDDVDSSLLRESVVILKQAQVEVEFRTTCVPGLVEEGDIRAIGELLCGEPLWVLQQFVAQPAMDEEMRQLTPHSPEVLRSFVAIAEEYVERAMIRGI